MPRRPLHLARLLPAVLLIPLLIPLPTAVGAAATSRAACAPDYSACGGSLPSPIGNLPCCNARFYCYTKGPYFSQCRPSRARLCGRREGVCSAGSNADTHLQCCDPTYMCVPASPLYWRCVPRNARWYRLIISHTPRRAFLHGPHAARLGATRLRPHDKLVNTLHTLRTAHPLRNLTTLSVVVPVMNSRERALLEISLLAIPAVQRVDRGVGVVTVFLRPSVPALPVARALAALPQVAEVHVPPQ